MESHKNYVIDTNVLLDDPMSLFKLRNGNENQIFIPYHVLLELDKLKKKPRLCAIVSQIIQLLTDHPDQFTLLHSTSAAEILSNDVDTYILKEIQDCGIKEPILVTNDKILQLQAGMRGIKSELYNGTLPFKPEAEMYTGFVDSPQSVIANCFMWNEERKPVFFRPSGEKVIDYQHRIWNVTPRNVYQNLALELMTDPDIHLATFQSEAGYGKSFLALATAFYLTLQLKTHQKIYIVKPMIEIGKMLGYLPGKIMEKMEPYTRYVTDLVLKLHELRPANRIFTNSEMPSPQFNSNRFELLPLAYIRGMNIENSVVVIDEMQNLTRNECRSLLSRMGEGVKCICLGDIHQVDNPALDMENNGLNWVVNKFKGNKIYAHMVLKGDKSRGPITDLVIRSGL